MSGDAATLTAQQTSKEELSVDSLASRALGWLGRRVLAMLHDLQDGVIEVTVPHGNPLRVGTPAPDHLTAAVHVRDRRFFREVVFGGSLGAAEAYLRGFWDCDDLTSLLRIFCRNLDRMNGMERGPARWGRGLATAAHRLAHNSRRGSRRNIAAHYDLSNEFFQIFLDPTMLYSSALFTTDEQTLEAASLAKVDRMCRKLDLQPGDHVVEIGTGWGAFAIHAAREYGCHVTTTTISRRQLEFASERVAKAGLTDRITLLSADYRDLRGTYDKLASIEMIEAVGHQYLPAYFQACDQLLKPGGLMAIQAIPSSHDRRIMMRWRGSSLPGGQWHRVGMSAVLPLPSRQ
ncbi:MAG: class I SAM-dependent methyltransferase, partial [Planctomycetaceae bacterium]|nr:class I SAM-dependent methyltransferase [Planctomycetaceae bacterium]